MTMLRKLLETPQELEAEREDLVPKVQVINTLKDQTRSCGKSYKGRINIQIKTDLGPANQDLIVTGVNSGMQRGGSILGSQEQMQKPHLDFLRGLSQGIPAPVYTKGICKSFLL
jgi:hypothetical protein